MANYTPEQQAEMDQLQTQLGAAPTAPSHTADQKAEMAQLQKQLGVSGDASTGSQPGLAERAYDALPSPMQVLRGGAKGLDYQRGVVAAGINKLIQKAGGQPIMTPEQSAAAVSPFTTETAPSYRTLLANAGVPEGPSTKDIPRRAGIPGIIAQYAPKVTARDVGGTAADAALDPLTYEGGGLAKIAEQVKDVPYLGRIANALLKAPTTPSRAVQGTADSLYGSGIKKIVLAGERNMNPNVQQTLMKNGVWGNAPAIEQGLDQIAQKEGSAAKAIEDQATQAGAKASLDRAQGPMWDELVSRASPDRRLMTPDEAIWTGHDATSTANAMGDKVSPTTMRGLKTQASQSAREARFSDFAPGAANPNKEAALTALAGGYKKETEDAIRRTLGDDAADEYVQRMQNLGDSINRKVRQAAGKSADSFEAAEALTPGDLNSVLLGSIAGRGLNGHTLEGGVTALAAKKLIELARTGGARTGSGLLLDRIANLPGVKPMLDSAGRQGFATATGSRPGSPLYTPYVVPKDQ